MIDRDNVLMTNDALLNGFEYVRWRIVLQTVLRFLPSVFFAFGATSGSLGGWTVKHENKYIELVAKGNSALFKYIPSALTFSGPK